MAPTTPLDFNRFYICDWVDDITDADEQDLDGQTAGYDYCYLYNPKLVRASWMALGDDPTYYAEGQAYITKDATIAGTWTVMGDVPNRTQLDYIDYYFKRHNGNIDKITSTDYFFYGYTTNDWLTTRDDDFTKREYCRGWFRGYDYIWDANSEFVYTVYFKLVVVWP